MEEKNIKDEQMYRRAFDGGFKLRLYNEELYNKVVAVFKDKSDEYSVAFIEGSKEAEKELEKKKQLNTDKNIQDLQNIRNRNSKDKSKDLER